MPSKNRTTAEPPARAAAVPPAPRGFTLIEVMVATAVMAIMVVMIGGLFQQASSSWDAGYIRAEGGMAIRAVVGALMRDVATAVDGRRFDLKAPVEVSSDSKITMYRLFPGADGRRDILKVVYSADGDSVTRQIGNEKPSTLYKKPQDASYSAEFEFVPGPETDQTRNSAGARPYEKSTRFPGEVAWTIPYVKVRCKLKRSGSFSGLSVRSLGRNGVENGTSGEKAKDDIVVR